jgi:hypothetical protein
LSFANFWIFRIAVARFGLAVSAVAADSELACDRVGPVAGSKYCVWFDRNTKRQVSVMAMVNGSF